MRRSHFTLFYHPFALSLILLFFVVVSILFLTQLRKTKLENYYSQQENGVRLAYKASLEMYKLAMNSFYNSSIAGEPAVLRLFAEGVENKGYARALAKGKLYRLLYHKYQTMSQHNLLQLHFHLANNTSYLRFHKPTKFGDNLLPVRRLVAYVNKEKRPRSGFETGKVRSGFRHVFPLKYHNRHLGSVELSVTSKAIIDAMMAMNPGKEYVFLMKNETIIPHIFMEQKWIYTPSQLHPDYVIEDALSLLQNSPQPISETVRKINKHLKNNKRVQAAMNRNAGLTVSVTQPESDYIVSLLPIYDAFNQPAGYIAAYKQDNTASLLLRESMIFTFFSLLSLGVIAFLLIGMKNRSIALDKERSNLKSINMTLAEGVLSIDHANVIRDVNPAACDIIGTTPENLIGRSITDILKQSGAETESTPVLATFINSSQKKVAFDGELCITDFKNEDHLIELSSRPIQEKGVKPGTVIAFHDITERKKIETALIKSEEKGRKLSTAIEQSPVGIIITDPLGIVEYINHKGVEQSGYSADEIIGKTPQLLYSTNVEGHIYKRMWQTIRQGREWQGDFEKKRKDGSLYWEHVSISPIRNDHGIITHYIGIKEDITSRIAMENELREREHFQHTLMTRLPVALIIIDAQTRCIEHVNPTAQELIGKQPKQIIGNICHNYICTSAKNNCPILDLKQEVDNSERILIDADGQKIAVLKTVSTFSFHGKKKLLECFIDIRKRIEIENQLRHSNEQLQASQERAEELAQQAGAANRAKSMFLANMSHEIRTPLNAILGYSQILAKDTEISHEQQKKITSISRCGAHLLDLMNNILETSKIEAGKITIRQEPVDLRMLFNDIKAIFHQACIDQGLRLVFKIDPKDTQISLMTDKGKVRQVIINLLSNSIKFTSHGQIVVACTITLTDKSNAAIAVEVSDTGVGIAENEHENLFLPFEQTASGINLHQGSGLGLSICRAFAQAMGGDVRLVKSIPAVITQFLFTFQAEMIQDSSARPIEQLPDSHPEPDDYQKSIQEAFTADRPENVPQERIRNIPDAIRKRLRSAVEFGDMNAFNTIIAEEPVLNGHLGEQLMHLGDRYKYDILLKLLA
ncbi:MAG: hypothetical protein CSA26_03480 [Desulfobacterales bacterium]|nr:MAG: hypothetical protein CSA26_03480 [Desulfobacterales bacterium]